MKSTNLSLNKLLRIVYSLLLLTFILPSGTIMSVPIKIILSLFLCLLFLPRFLVMFKVDRITLIFILILGCLILWSGLSLLNGYDTYLSFFKNYFSSLFVVWISYEFYRYKIIDIGNIIKLIGFITFFLVSIKITFSILLSLNVLEINSLVDFYSNIFNAELTTMYFPIGSFIFYRLMLANDNIPYIYLSFCLISNDKKVKKVFLVLVMCIYTFIIYSRISILQYLLIILLYLIIYYFNYCKTRQRKIRFFLLSFVGGCILSLLLNKLGIIEALIFRFNSSSSSYSDNIRDEQYKYLIEGIKENFLLGQGTGAYLKNYLRSDTIYYSYELEYLSFLYQFGIIGFALIIGSTILLYYKICFKNKLNFNIKAMLFFDFLFFLIKPIFNPGFISSNAGFIIVSIFIFSRKDYCETI